jgi:hypothetical protein
MSNNPGSGSVQMDLSLDVLDVMVVDGNGTSIAGTVTNAAGVPVPEPGTWGAAAALLALGAAAWRRVY